MGTNYRIANFKTYRRRRPETPIPSGGKCDLVSI
jgi:hypothetical protein